MTEAIGPYDYKRFAILFVDDEDKARKYFRRLFGETFRVLEASDGNEAYDVFQQNANEIGVIVTDQRMPNETGTGFLARLGDDAGNVVKILSTAYADLEAAIDSVNRGGIYRYITKPWDIPELEVTLKRAMEFFIVKHERDGLMRAKVQALSNMLFASRLASFALVPVAAGLECQRAAEAVADFVRLGAAGGPSGDPMAALSGDWKSRHGRQLGFAATLQTELDAALKGRGDDPTGPLRASLAEVDGVDIEWDEGEQQINLSSDPFPAQLNCLLGASGAGDPAVAAKLLAGMMALYHAGGRLSRVHGEGECLLQVASGPDEAGDVNPGDEAARWLFDDELLLSTALGLL
jgi:CheY-like chemotaxis protein